MYNYNRNDYKNQDSLWSLSFFLINKRTLKNTDKKNNLHNLTYALKEA